MTSTTNTTTTITITTTTTTTTNTNMVSTHATHTGQQLYDIMFVLYATENSLHGKYHTLSSKRKRENDVQYFVKIK